MKAPYRLLLALGVVVASGSQSTVAQSSPQLFFDVGPASQSALHTVSGSPGVLSRSVVGMRLDALFGSAGAAARTMGIRVGGQDWVAQLRWLDAPDVNGFRSWVGVIDGVEYSHVVITERDGVVSGLINAVSDAYQIRTVTPGTYVLEQLDVSAPSGRSTVIVPPALPEAPRDGVASDDGSRIDLLILYTPEARNTAGGGAEIEIHARRIVTDTNSAFINSGVTPRVRNVGARELGGYEESGRVSTDLQRIANSAAARTLRDELKADLVHIILSNRDPDYSGASYLLTVPTATDFIAYSAAKLNSLPSYEPVRQIAFNFGASVAPDDPPKPGVRAFSSAYKNMDANPAFRFRTLQAESCGTIECSRILYFSSSSGTYLNAPRGTALQDNVRTINEMALVVAKWRQEGNGGTGGGIPLAPTNPRTRVSGMNVSLLWDPSGGSLYRLQIGTASGLANVFDGDVGNVVSVDMTLGLGSYFWRVFALNLKGESSPASAESSFAVTSTCGIATAPRNLMASISGSHVLLSWNPPALGTASAYVVEAGSTSGAVNLYHGAVGSQPVVQAMVPFGVYYVRVRASNGCGTGPASNEVFFTVGALGTPPAPQDVRLTLTSTMVSVTWNLGAGAVPPTAYILEAGSAPGLADLGVVEVAGHTRSFTTGRPSPGSYYVRIKARHGTAVGPASPDVLLAVP